MNKEIMTQEQRGQLIEKLRNEYNELNGKIARLNAFLCDIDFVNKVPDPIEQSLMSMLFKSMKGYLDNLRGRIMFQEMHQLREENARKQIDEWKKMKGHIIPVNLDEQHHCGQDATCQVDDGIAVVDKPVITGESLEQLVGTTVRLFHKPGHKCEGCPYEVKSYGGKCEYKKVELVGGYYLCLAPLPNSIVTE